MFESEADKPITDLIETLCTRASKISCFDDDREIFVNQIAKLRASMNPTINITIKK